MDFFVLHFIQKADFFFLSENKYEDDFEEEADNRDDRRHIIGLRDDETRVNGKTISVDIAEKEKEQEKEGVLPEHRRVEGYSSEDEDAEGPRSKSIEVTADIHSQKKKEQQKKRRRSTSSSSSSSSSASENELTPRPKSPERQTRSPEPSKVAETAIVEVHTARSEESAPPKSDRTDRSTTSGSLTTETESTIESNRQPVRPASQNRRRSSSSSSSSTLSSDSEDEKYRKKKQEKKQRVENERRRKEEEERSRKEAEEREKQRKKQAEEEEKKRLEAEEERKMRFELQRQQSQDRLRQMEEQRKKQELERQQQMSEQFKAKEEERQRRVAEEERIQKNYQKQLSLIQSQRESESTLSVTDTTVSEEPKVDIKVEKTPVKEEKRKSSSSSSSSSSESDSENERKSSYPPQKTLASVKTEEPAQDKAKAEVFSSLSSETKPKVDTNNDKTPVKEEKRKSSSSSSSSESDSEDEKRVSSPVQKKMDSVKGTEQVEEKKQDSRRSSTSSASSTTSSSSDGEYTLNKESKAEQKKVGEIQASQDYKKPVEVKKEVNEPSSADKSALERKDSSSSTSSSGYSRSWSRSDAEFRPPEKPVEPSEKDTTKRSASSSSLSSHYSASEASSDGEFKPPVKPTEPAPFGGIERETTFEKQEMKIQERSPEPVLKSIATAEEYDVVKAQKEETEDSSSDSSSSDSDSSDSEDEREGTQQKQGTKPLTSESEPETMHGGHDPDNVAQAGKSVESHLAKGSVQAPMTHFGSILPMLKGSNAVELSGVKLDDSQLTEINNFIAEVEHIKSVTLRNCALDDSSFKNLAMALQVTQSSPNLLNFSLNQLGAKSLSPLAVAIKNKPSIEIVILNGNPVGNVGCKVLMDALVKTKDPFPFLRRGSGYLTPSEARKQEDEGKAVTYDDDSKDGGCNITELDLGDAKISDAGIAEISRFLEHNKTLVSLNLNGNRQISSSGWERLGQALKVNKTLKSLSLDYTDIGDSGIENLAKGLRVNTGLRCLELESSGLTEKGGQILRDLLKSNTSILELTVTPGNNISDEMLQEIRKYVALNNSSK